MKNLKTLSIIAIVLIGLFATSCTPENLDNDQTEQQVKHKNQQTSNKRIVNLVYCRRHSSTIYWLLHHLLFYSYKSFPDSKIWETSLFT